MRKNFLILMLLSLLPLAGWAVDDLTGNPNLEVSVGNIEYGKAALAPEDIRVVLSGTDIPNTYWEVEGYYETNDGTSPKIADLSTLTVGTTRYAKVVFKGVYSGYAYGSFSVTKAKLVVKIEDQAHFTMVYKTTAAKPAITDANVTGTLRGAAIDHASLLTYVNYNATKLATYSWTGENVSATGYAIDFKDAITLKDAANYEMEIEARTMKITAAPLTVGLESLFAYTHDYTAAYTYTAAGQKPTVTVKWNHDNNPDTDPITLVEGTDFTVAYKVGGVVKATPTDVATYNAYITGIGNYSTEVAVAALNFDIAPATLTVMALPKNKPYDGAPFAVGTAQFSIVGRVGGDAQKTVTGLVATELDPFTKNVASYTVGVNTDDAKIGGTVDLDANYAIDVIPVEWEITQAPLTVTAKNVEMTKGEGYPGFDAEPVTVTGAVADELDGIKANYTVTYANAEGEPLYNLDAADLEVKEYPNAIKLNQINDAVVANYKVTLVKGSLIVKGAAFNVWPVVVSDIEYGDKYTIDYYTNGEINKDQLVFVIDGKEISLADAKAGTGLPTARGNYEVTIKDGTVIGTGSSLNGTPTVYSSAFNIVKRKLALTVKDQTVHIYDPATIINELAAGDNGNDGIVIGFGKKLAFDDKITDLNLTYSLDGAVVEIDEAGKITSAASLLPYEEAILVEIGNENYEFADGVYAKGDLYIIDTFDADLAAATADATITEAANNGSLYNVTLSGVKLKANTWNVMVLPFAVKPLDFCYGIGTYAVFNTLKKVEKDASDPLKDKIYFQLNLNEIPANQPFLVKPVEAVDFDVTYDLDGDPATTNDIFKKCVIPSVTFVKADPIQTNVDGVEFIGTYAAAADINSDNWWGMQGGDFKHFSAAKAGALKFTKAYIQLTSGASAAEFFVEDIDNNGVTAIKSLNTDTMKSVDLKGWYTVGGVKLQGAPTEKGVYINNGKKVVIK